MFLRPFHPDRFLRSVYGTEPFVEYCREHRIAFEQNLSEPCKAEALRRWMAALAQVPHEEHAQVELDLAAVNEMAGSDSIAHLIEAALEGELPPDSIPRGAPLAFWFFMRHPAFFHEVFLHHQIQEVESWRIGQGPSNCAISDSSEKKAALTAALREFFRLHEGTGRFCIVDAHQFTDSLYFVARLADRLQFLDVFTENGRPSRHRLRPAFPVLFVYYPAEGTVLLKSHLRSQGRIAELFECFGQAVLGTSVACGDDMFDLDLLKRPFRALPDAEDMELVRVKALHLRYPERSGRRQLKLETLLSDQTDAIEQLLRLHIAPATLPDLRVCHAELQVRLRGARGSKNHLIQLWPNRCSLNQTDLGNRFRTCLRRWGLSHAR